MIIVLAAIKVKTGKTAGYLPILKANVPAVRKEKGCIEYLPAIDFDTRMPAQALDSNVVTILEKWESMQALEAHLGSPHMLEYRDKVKDLVENVTIKVLQEV